ncbi:hypothetical protein [Pectinatus frisingensis]|uniref:hypothetical protein n=1 Tax=Pectinatus frisingensis TaxID=865 RepID=UPI0018C54E43|nr:hypothetical protein [Pectinatus frisingensis]
MTKSIFERDIAFSKKCPKQFTSLLALPDDFNRIELPHVDCEIIALEDIKSFLQTVKI